MALLSGFVSRAILALIATLLISGCKAPWSRPPLAVDLQDLCLKSRLKPDAFFPLAQKMDGLKETNSGVAPDGLERSATWTHRIDGHAALVAFSSRPAGAGVAARSSCLLSDFQDRGASIDWLSRWTGSKIPNRHWGAYYLAVADGQARLFAVPNTAAPPPPEASGDVYVLMVDSDRDKTTITLGRSSSWWPSMVRAPLTPP